uniref:Uncharacterized protein n=1 Tax=Oryza punctata TaxID=4537 RepID=A0A0E0JZB2_ORYPU
MTTPWRSMVVPASGGRWRLRRRRCFGPRYRTPGNTLTSKKVFTCVKSNNRWLQDVGSPFAHHAPCGWPQRIGCSPLVMEMMDGCYCATSSSSLYHVAISFHDSPVDYRSPHDCPLHYQSQDTDRPLHPYSKIQ